MPACEGCDAPTLPRSCADPSPSTALLANLRSVYKGPKQKNKPVPAPEATTPAPAPAAEPKRAREEDATPVAVSADDAPSLKKQKKDAKSEPSHHLE